jgi:hypothetical protein
MLAAYNAKIQNILGSKIVGKDLWGTYYGVELEAEVDVKSNFVKDKVKLFDAEEQRTLFLPVSNEDKNPPIAHIICDALLPFVKEFCIIKRDGSLKMGMEIVSLPMSLDMHRTQWDAFFENVPKMGLKISPTCGMHVHASRENLSSLQIGKVLAFLHDPANIEFIKDIAGRVPPKKYANISDRRKITDWSRHSNRYDGFNLTNGTTVEFRIFKGTLEKAKMLSNLEFCVALLAFTFPGVAGIRENNLRGFVNFVQKNSKLYPALAQFMKAKKYIVKE